MTLDALIRWIDDAMHRLPSSRPARDRIKHIRRLYLALDSMGLDWSLRADWHALAVKIAAVMNEAAPPEPSRPSAKVRERRRWVSSEKAAPSKRSRRSSRPRAKQAERTPLEMSPKLQAAFDAVESRRPIVFVTGGAGTGKSTFIRELRARLPARQSIVLAPTGVAALNAGGQTIHSFCRLPLRVVLPEDARTAKDSDVVAALDLLIVDEISMVRADILDGIDAFLRLNRKSKLPFGGVQVVLVGDLFQLPPVVTPRDAPMIAERYPSPHFFSAHCLRGLKFFPIELDIVYRQRDATFANLLANIRDGEDAAGALRQLNEHCVGRVLGGQHLILVPTRQAAAEENEARLAALRGKPRTYTALREGSFATAPDDRLPAPAKLTLKSGAQVMFIRNDPERRWVNGTLAVVMSLAAQSVGVRLEDGTSLEVEPMEWQDIEYAFDDKKKAIVEEVAGTYTQFPLMPAWAVTIHKAQGLTLASVMVDLHRGAFAEGQVYVALSRCQTMEGLSLRRPVRAFEVRCSEAARAFYRKMRR
ncbi:MAG: ATP-dependent DNA helicase [Thermoanaerobaculia bacterium]